VSLATRGMIKSVGLLLRISAESCANPHDALLHTPSSRRAGQSLVQWKSGIGCISNAPCAKVQLEPLEHAPMTLNLHSFVLWKSPEQLLASPMMAAMLVDKTL